MTRDPANPPTLQDLTERLRKAVHRGDEQDAATTVRRALEEGTDPEGVLLDVIAAVQGRVGEEWADNRTGVAQEHAATAINDRAVALVPLLPSAPTEPTRGRITVACVDGEWHGLPARLPAEVLRPKGWHVDHLGAQVLAARGVPANSLQPTLELLGRELKDFPRAAGILRSGSARLTRTPLTAAGTHR